ncbi:telomere-protecting terminal protein Tpg [Streptomyces sp. NPDC003860]
MMKKVLNALGRVVHDKMTAAQKQRMPKTLKGKVAALLRDEKKTGGQAGAVKRLARRLDVSPEAAYRYLRGKRKTPPKAIMDRIDAEVLKIHKPRVQQNIIKDAKRSPVKVNMRAEIGYTNSKSRRTTPDSRMRNIAKEMPQQYAERLWDALRDGDEAGAKDVIAEWFQNDYIHEGGGNNVFTACEVKGIDFVDFEIRP